MTKLVSEVKRGAVLGMLSQVEDNNWRIDIFDYWNGGIGVERYLFTATEGDANKTLDDMVEFWLDELEEQGTAWLLGVPRTRHTFAEYQKANAHAQP